MDDDKQPPPQDPRQDPPPSTPIGAADDTTNVQVQPATEDDDNNDDRQIAPSRRSWKKYSAVSLLVAIIAIIAGSVNKYKYHQPNNNVDLLQRYVYDHHMYVMFTTHLTYCNIPLHVPLLFLFIPAMKRSVLYSVLYKDMSMELSVSLHQPEPPMAVILVQTHH